MKQSGKAFHPEHCFNQCVIVEHIELIANILGG